MAGIDASSAALLVRALTNRAIQERGKYDDTNRAISQGAQGVSDVLLRNQARDEELADQQAEMDFTRQRDEARRAERLADQDFTIERDEARNAAILDRAAQSRDASQAAQQLDRRAAWDAAFPGSVPAPEVGDIGPTALGGGTPLPQNQPPAPYDPYGTPNRPEHLPPSSTINAMNAQRQDEIAAFEAQQAATEEAQKAELERQQKAYIFRPSVGDNGEMGLPEFGVVGERAMQVYGYIPFEIGNEFMALQSKQAKLLKAQAEEAEKPGKPPIPLPGGGTMTEDNPAYGAVAKAYGEGEAGRLFPEPEPDFGSKQRALVSFLANRLQAINNEIDAIDDRVFPGPEDVATRKRLVDERKTLEKQQGDLVGYVPSDGSDTTGNGPDADVSEAQKRGFFQNPETGVWEKR